MTEHATRDPAGRSAPEAAPPDRDERSSASSINHAVLLPLLACNARCPFCSTRVYTPDGIVSAAEHGRVGAPQRRLAEHTISLDDAKERYRRLRAEGVPRITLQGGEPTLWPGLIELIRYGRELGVPEQVVVTNGIRLAEAEFARDLSASGASTLALSIFGATAGVHDESLGLKGAFDALVLGVEHLVALPAGGADRMAQLIVHARNLHELPEMLTFWHGLGMRHFAVRLLREVANTEGPEGRQWFFDLARLREPLVQTLERATELAETSVVFPEIFYCLLPPEQIGFVVGDLAAGRRIAGAVVHEARHVSGSPRPARRRLPQASEQSECATCDLTASCARPEEPYRSLYTGELRSVRVLDEVRSLVAATRLEAPTASMSRLLRIEPSELATAGVDGSLLEHLRPSRASVPRPPSDTLVRFLPLAALGASDDLSGATRDVLSRLVEKATPAMRASVRFLAERASCIHRESAFLIFAGKVRVAGGSGPFWVVLYDPVRAPEPELARLLAPT